MKILKALALTLCFILVPSWLNAQQSMKVIRQASVLARPDTGAVVLDVLAPGVAVEVMGGQGRWSMVRMPGTVEVGWVENSALSANAPAAVAAGSGGRKAGAGDLTDTQISVLRNRVSALDGSLYRIEGQVDRLLDKVSTPGNLTPSTEMMQPQASPAGEMAAQPAGQEMTTPVRFESGRFYRWSNRFIMGKYFRGGEDLYGLGVACKVDRRGVLELGLDAVYGLGDARGQDDDFIEWGLGARFNVKPSSYWIYPFFQTSVGYRHQVGDVDAGPLRYLVCSPGGGVTAELGDIFTLEAASQAVFLFADGERRNEGRITFSVSFGY
ncbi:hypothetical protein LLH00_00295 [bacterium]|nr:hypothetical protein [bacterium]